MDMSRPNADHFQILSEDRSAVRPRSIVRGPHPFNTCSLPMVDLFLIVGLTSWKPPAKPTEGIAKNAQINAVMSIRMSISSFAVPGAIIRPSSPAMPLARKAFDYTYA